MKRVFIPVCLAVLSVCISACCLLLYSNLLEPLLTVFKHSIYRVESADVRNLRVGVGLSGLEIEDLKSKLAGKAIVVPYRIWHSEVRMAKTVTYQPMLRIGRSAGDIDALSGILKGFRNLQMSRCLDVTEGGLATGGGPITADGKQCEVVRDRWNSVVLERLGGRDRIGLISTLLQGEAYLHPLNQIYQALVIPMDRSASDRSLKQVFKSFELSRKQSKIGNSKHVLKYSSWQDEIINSQRPLLILLILLGSATLLSSLVAAFSLGLMEAAMERRADWIRVSLGEMSSHYWRRLGKRYSMRFGLISVALLLAWFFAQLLMCDSLQRTLMFSVLAALCLILGEFGGRIGARMQKKTTALLTCAVCLQVFTVAACVGIAIIERTNFEAGQRKDRGFRVDGLSAWRLNLNANQIDAQKWKSKLGQLQSTLTGRDEEAAYIMPLPMQRPTTVTVSSNRGLEWQSSTARYFDVSRAGLDLLQMGCSDISTIPEALLEKSVVISQSVSVSLFGDKQAIGSRVRIVDREYQVAGVCRDSAGMEMPAVFLFEPTNWVYLLLDDRVSPDAHQRAAKEKGLMQSGAWEFVGGPNRLRTFWDSAFLNEGQRLSLMQSLGILALGACIVGLVWVLILEARQKSGEVATRLALGGTGFRVTVEISSRLVTLILGMNVTGSLLAIWVGWASARDIGQCLTTLCSAVLLVTAFQLIVLIGTNSLHIIRIASNGSLVREVLRSEPLRVS
ncbi:MAG: ABC transporter permease [Acidobacteria bacterium]|nr:ABC transporter permease [Acidobacteriota bacterium]